MRSDKIKVGLERAPHRALLKACGVKNSDMGKPFIAVCNSYVDIVPGHTHLQEFGALVKQAIRDAGGVPFEFNTIALCDGIAMGHNGMRFSLPSRELIADTVESMAMAHMFDGMVCIPNCDKVIPGMLMATVRLNIPTVFVSGGAMKAGCSVSGKAIDLISVFEAVGGRQQGKTSEDELQDMEDHACPTCGSCSGMFTANSMNCLCEAIGIGLPGNGTRLAVSEERRDLVKEAGRRIIELVKGGVRPSDIITRDALKNAFALDMAMGGSTNTVLHILALANEAGIDFGLDDIAAISAKTPYICKVSPANTVHIEDVDRVGGISSIMKEVNKRGLIIRDCKSVAGKTIGEIIDEAADADGDIIHTLDNPYSERGGLRILRGNLAPDGAVVKAGAVDPKMMKHTGPAVIFESQEASCEGIMAGRIKAGDVVVIRYEGPAGGPGMQEMLSPTAMISGMGLGDKCALITDGRFSGGTRGACIGHISPEAAARGPIAALQDGDIIEIDIDKGMLTVQLSNEEIQRRLSELPAFESKVESRWLRRYARLVRSADTGAVLE